VPLIRYTVDAAKSLVVVHARSSVHDTDARWTKLSGLVTVDPADPGAGAEARVTVDMREFDAGDRMKNWKLRGDLEPDSRRGRDGARGRALAHCAARGYWP
jgi:polyisoprenoid-binding protein YceI